MATKKPRRRNRLKALRADREFTQLTLAQKSKIHVTRLSYIERDLVEATPDEREQLVRALKTTEREAFPAADEHASA
jgi:transcriptional regulator with XRE-family HTH domain